MTLYDLLERIIYLENQIYSTDIRCTINGSDVEVGEAKLIMDGERNHLMSVDIEIRPAIKDVCDGIFGNAKFGDMFITRGGRLVSYWYCDEKDPYGKPHYVTFENGASTHYPDSGIYDENNPNTTEFDIVAKYEKPKS